MTRIVLARLSTRIGEEFHVLQDDRMAQCKAPVGVSIDGSIFFVLIHPSEH